MNRIVLKVSGNEEAKFDINGEPHSEADLLKYDEYIKFFWRIGLGAPVLAEVTVKKGLFSKETYKFSFYIKGNSMKKENLESVIAKYESVSRCLSMNFIMDEGITRYVYAFGDNDQAYKLYLELEGICNVGTSHMQDRETGEYLIVIEYHAIR